MGLERIAAPALEPVSLEEAREHLRVNDQTQDTYIEALITAARELAETHTGGRQFITAQWKWTAFGFPGSGSYWWGTYGTCAEMIQLPRPPLQTVESVKYVDPTGTLQTLSPTVYDVVSNLPYGGIVLKYGQFWPATRDEPDAVQVEFTAGYGDNPEDVPATIRHAIKLLVGHYFEIREPVVTGSTATTIPLTVRSLLASKALVPLR